MRASTRHLQFSVSQTDDSIIADTLLQCVADDAVSVGMHKGDLFVVLEEYRVDHETELLNFFLKFTDTP